MNLRKNTFKKKHLLSGVLNTKDRRLSRYFLLVFLVLVFWFYGFGDYGIYRYVRLNRDLNTIKAEIAVLEQELNQLQEEQKLIGEKDPEYYQRIARERFGLVKEGEKIYQLAPKTGKR